jgi:hypothetical protein
MNNTLEPQMRAPSLPVGTGWIPLEATDEPTVVLTFKGYAPVLPVKNRRNGLVYILYISAKSLAEPLEKFRASNGGLFKGLTFEIRKESEDRFAKYEVRYA